MSITHIKELQQLVIRDLWSEEQQEKIIYNLLQTVQEEIKQHCSILIEYVKITAEIPILVSKRNWLQEQEVQLNKYDQLDEMPSNIFNSLGLINIFSYIESKLIRILRREGYSEVAETMGEVVQTIKKERIIRRLIQLDQQRLELEELATDLEREKRKYESKILKAQQTRLLETLYEQRKEYQKDTILLLEGLVIIITS